MRKITPSHPRVVRRRPTRSCLASMSARRRASLSGGAPSAAAGGAAGPSAVMSTAAPESAAVGSGMIGLGGGRSLLRVGAEQKIRLLRRVVAGPAVVELPALGRPRAVLVPGGVDVLPVTEPRVVPDLPLDHGGDGRRRA